MNQESVFMGGEGDGWFHRNRDHLVSIQANDHPLHLLQTYKIVPMKVLEVGASNGYRLAAIAGKYSADCFGIDASAEAIRDGKKRFPHLHLSHGVASTLTFGDGEFDLVIVNFVFHWLDRDNLLRCAAEIDRVLRWHGFLIIGDFLPPAPCKTRYHHLPDADIWTYKQNCSELFTGSSLYHVVGSVTGDHASNEITADAAPQERIGTFLLQKQADYTETRFIIKDGRLTENGGK